MCKNTVLPPCQNGNKYEDIFLSPIYLRDAVGIRGHKESGAMARPENPRVVDEARR